MLGKASILGIKSPSELDGDVELLASISKAALGLVVLIPTCEKAAIENDKNIYNGEKYIVYGKSFEEGNFSFENLVTDEPFDASKVKLDVVTLWDNLKLVHAVCYGNQTLCIEDGDTNRKSTEVWIMANIAESTDGSRESVLKLIKNKEPELEHADDSLKADKEVVLAAVQNAGEVLEYADDSLKEDEDILEASGKK